MDYSKKTFIVSLIIMVELIVVCAAICIPFFFNQSNIIPNQTQSEIIDQSELWIVTPCTTKIIGDAELLQYPSAQSNVLAKIPDKATVIALGLYQDYFYIKIGDISGYVFKTHFSLDAITIEGDFFYPLD